MTEAHDVRLGIACSRFNEAICDRLLDGAERAVRDFGVVPERTRTLRVPGAWELVHACASLAREHPAPDAIVALGALVRGETPHFDVLAQAVAHGLVELTLARGIPVVFGVLTVDTLDQAVARSGGDETNKGYEAVQAAVEMAALARG